jgi:hypothetical protein
MSTESDNPLRDEMAEEISKVYDCNNSKWAAEAALRVLRRKGIPLTLTEDGPGSRAEIADYVRTVIEQRTTPNDDTTAERLAQNITTSILHRLGAGYSVAAKH